MNTPFAILSSRVVTPEATRDAAILIEGETIAGVIPRQEVPSSYATIDMGDLMVMPGLVDTHVHVNEPGRTEWEGFETATKAAAAGGITSLVDMPLNSSPVTTTVDAFRKKLEAARGKLWVDCGFYGGVIPGNTDHLKPLIEEGVLGFKAFLIHSGIDEFPNARERDLNAAMPLLANASIPLLAHCELTSDESPSSIRPATSFQAYLASRPRSWEHQAIDLMIRLCRQHRCPTHIVHLSSADALPTLTAARKEELPLTVETCPHYLYFDAEEIPDADPRFKCAPPIRERENRERLWTALREGTIDFIVSDHSPSTPDLKLLDTGDLEKAWGGIPSLQLGLSIIWTEAKSRGFTASDVAQWMSQRPAALVGLSKRKGSIAEGFDADLVVWDPDGSFTVKGGTLFHRHAITPYDGRRLLGKVERTYLRGHVVFDSRGHVGEPAGRPLLRTSQ